MFYILILQTPVASNNSSVPRTPIKPVAQSPGTPVRPCPHVAAAPGDSSDTTDISEEVSFSISFLFIEIQFAYARAHKSDVCFLKMTVFAASDFSVENNLLIVLIKNDTFSKNRKPK